MAFERDSINWRVWSSRSELKTEHAGRLLLGLTTHYGAITNLRLTWLHMQISLSNIWWLHKDQSPILTDQTQNSCGGTISSFRHTHRGEVSEKLKRKKNLPVVGLDRCVNPLIVCWCQDALILTHAHIESHFNQHVGNVDIKTFHSQCNPPNGAFKLGKWSIDAEPLLTLATGFPHHTRASNLHQFNALVPLTTSKGD